MNTLVINAFCWPGFFARKCLKWYLMLLFFLPAIHLHAGEIEVKYYLPGAEKVYLVWGVNDWQQFDHPPAGTIRKGNVMHTLMVKNGDSFTLKINIPAGDVIDYTFIATRKAGPFGIDADYWDLNKDGNNKFFRTVSGSSSLIEKKGAVNFKNPSGQVALSAYSYTLFFFLTFLALLIFLLKRYYFKVPAGHFSQRGFFAAVSFALVAGLTFTRLVVTELVFQVLVKPFSIASYVLSVMWTDLLFAALLILLFGLMMYFKKARRFIMGLYVMVAILSLIISLVNMKVTELIGWPLNYQWLYYSDFLNSTDASKAIGANITQEYITGCILLLLSAAAVAWLVYHAYGKWPRLVAMVLPLLLAGSFACHLKIPVSIAKTANPVFFFIASVNKVKKDAAGRVNPAGASEFSNKNTDSLTAGYATLFRNSPVKNVIILVLESTPAEYITPYNSSFNATPFIERIKNEAALFENIYAHTPATNKSMFSILCSTYPNLSFRTITKENPDIHLPSITSELENEHYRTLFLNSGDNSFQNAAGFLQKRGFDEVLDFKTNNCGTVYSDNRFSNDQLDGVDDSCLAARFFNWQQQDKSSPFFAMLWTFQTHYPYFTNGKDLQYQTDNASLNKYLNALHRADETLRQLVEGLKRQQLLESTLIVVTGDHGEAFGRHDQTTHAANIYEENLHVPLLFINPVLFKGERMRVTGGISDIAPTIFSILNKKAPAVWQGENLFSLSRRSAVYFFSPYSQLLFGLREDHFKFIFNASENSFKLYDLATDKHETKDISKEQPEFMKRANGKLQAWMKYQTAYTDKILNTVVNK